MQQPTKCVGRFEASESTEISIVCGSLSNDVIVALFMLIKSNKICFQDRKDLRDFVKFLAKKSE